MTTQQYGILPYPHSNKRYYESLKSLCMSEFVIVTKKLQSSFSDIGYKNIGGIELLCFTVDTLEVRTKKALYNISTNNRIKDSTNGCKTLDIILFQREGRLTEEGSGYCSSSWNNTRTGENRGNISVYTTPDYVRLYYISINNSSGEKHNIDYNIQVTWTPCNYGGKRAWFICKCGRRVRKLFQSGVYFYCRHCQRLNYYSQQQSKSDQLMDSIRKRIYKIQKRLKTEQDNNNYYYAPKPKGMHYKKYERLLKQIRELGQLKDRVFVSESIRRFGMSL